MEITILKKRLIQHNLKEGKCRSMFVKSGTSRRCALLLALIAVVLFAFVGASFAAEKVIKVGALFPLTGPYLSIK